MPRHDTPIGRVNPELVTEFRDAARRYATAEKLEDREDSVRTLTALWGGMRERADAAGRLSPRFPTEERVHGILGSTLRDDDPKKRNAASDALVSMFDRVDKGLAATGTPSEPGARWRPDRPPLAPAEKDKLLKQARADTRNSARSMADAIRKVVAARHKQGVPLYATFSTETRAHYAIAATDYAFGLVAVAPIPPGTTKRSAPWGMFRVRSSTPPADALARFAVSPPLPVRGELLQSRSQPIRFAPLHEPAPRADHGDNGGDDDAIR